MRNLILISIFLLITGLAAGQALDKNTILGVHSCKVELNSYTTMDEFVRFFKEKYIPEYEKNFPGIKLFLARGDRGEDENSIAILFLIESKTVRDKYFPKPGEPSEMTKKGLEKLEPVRQELRERCTYTSTYTDWIIL